MIHETIPKHNHDQTQDIKTQFRPLPKLLLTIQFFLIFIRGVIPFGRMIFTTKRSWKMNTNTKNPSTRLTVVVQILIHMNQMLLQRQGTDVSFKSMSASSYLLTRYFFSTTKISIFSTKF